MTRISNAPRANFADADLQRYVKNTALDLQELQNNKAKQTDMAKAQADITAAQGSITTLAADVLALAAALATKITGKWVHKYYANTSDPANFVLDSTQDWRDRYVQVLGNVIVYSTASECVPGGNDDNELGSKYTTINGVADVGQFNDWFYTRIGGASMTTDPYIYTDWNAAAEKAYIWVDSATGYLMLSIDTARASSYRNTAANLLITWSDDQGGH